MTLRTGTAIGEYFCAVVLYVKSSNALFAPNFKSHRSVSISVPDLTSAMNFFQSVGPFNTEESVDLNQDFCKSVQFALLCCWQSKNFGFFQKHF